MSGKNYCMVSIPLVRSEIGAALATTSSEKDASLQGIAHHVDEAELNLSIEVYPVSAKAKKLRKIY